MIPCIWCGDNCKSLIKNKYCDTCKSKCVRECTTCHKPYPSLRFFKLDDKRCNSCHNRYLKQKQKVKQISTANMKRKKQQPNFPSILLLKKFAEERARFKKRQQLQQQSRRKQEEKDGKAN